ncbi:hypothetical protein Droror1_Dr00023805 [Drosera rotundifolia]
MQNRSQFSCFVSLYKFDRISMAISSLSSQILDDTPTRVCGMLSCDELKVFAMLKVQENELGWRLDVWSMPACEFQEARDVPKMWFHEIRYSS